MIQLSSYAVYLEIGSDPTGWELSPNTHTHTTSDINQKVRLSPVLLTNGCISAVSVTPSLGEINLLEHLTELRERINLIDY